MVNVCTMARDAKKPPVYSANPELFEKSQKPVSTIAMGMKSTFISTQSWKDQVRREDAIVDAWRAVYDPHGRVQQREYDALSPILARDKQRRAEYLSVTHNPDLHTFIYRRNVVRPAAENDCEALHEGTCTRAKWAQHCESACCDNNSTRGVSPHEEKPGVLHLRLAGLHNPSASDRKSTITLPMLCTDKTNSHRREQNASSNGDGGGGARHASCLPYAQRTSRCTTPNYGRNSVQRYMRARCASKSVHARFPGGPVTSSQVVGWKCVPDRSASSFSIECAMGGGSNDSTRGNERQYEQAHTSALYSDMSRRRQKTAFHKPEDSDCALLLGYTTVPM